MSIELLVVLGVVLGGIAVWYFNKGAKSTDLNNDGKTDFNDLVVAVDNTVAGAKTVADVNKDGKVDVADVKVVAKKAKASAKKAATNAKAATVQAAATVKAATAKKTKAPKK
jgi:hypothetical protein